MKTPLYVKLMVYLVGLLCLLSSCSLSQRMESARDKLMAEYRAMPDWATLPSRPLSWARAVAMLENTPEMQQARNHVEKTRREKERVFRDFIPIVDLGYYFNSALLKSADNYGRNSSFNVNVIFNLPSITRLPITHYTRSLAHFQAEWELKLKRRELQARLWQHFHEERLVTLQQQLEDAAPAALEADSSLRHKTRELQNRTRTQELCRLLNDFSARWVPVSQTTPRINWRHYRKLAKTPDELTQIGMALKLETARLRKMGVALRYIPNVQTNFYSPTLFSVTGGNKQGFLSGERDVRLNLNVYTQLDTRLDIWSEWAQAKADYHLVEKELTRQMHDYRNKMELLLDSWQTYDDWLQSTQDYIDFRRSQGVCDAAGVQALYAEDLQLQNELLEQAQKNLERECALIQEYGLPGEQN